jgi:hypothetical protein
VKFTTARVHTPHCSRADVDRVKAAYAAQLLTPVQLLRASGVTIGPTGPAGAPASTDAQLPLVGAEGGDRPVGSAGPISRSVPLRPAPAPPPSSVALVAGDEDDDGGPGETVLFSAH